MEFLVIRQGSLFKLTKEEYEIIMDIIREKNPIKRVKAYESYTEENFLKEVFMEENQYENIINLLKYKKNIILQGPPGVGKTFIAKRIAYSIMGEKDDSRVEMVQFHQSYTYEDFIMGYRPDENGFKLKYGILCQFCKKALNDPNRPCDNLLPNMETDIELEGTGRKLIIDTKYYTNALVKSNFSETKKLISSNLYQIFAYVKNTEYNGEVSGMLLYPTVDYDLDQKYKMSGNNIFVKTLNLGEDFEKIKSRLLDISNILRYGYKVS